MRDLFRWLTLFGLLLCLCACGGGGGSGGGGDEEDDDDDGRGIPAASQSHVLVAWNDLGMHCLNPTYDTAVILPPYNNVWAQLVERGNPPRIITNDLILEYQVLGNTFSFGKTYAPFASNYGQFWTYDQLLFGVDLIRDTGLNLKVPLRHNGLSGSMYLFGDHFEINGVPLTPVNDVGTWDPYQIMEITAKNGSGTVLATTRATVPTSDEINCAKCHGADPFNDILEEHDDEHGTNLQGSTPVLCADCHGSPALGTDGPGEDGYLSEAIHGSHAGRGAACYDCHPGPSTKCSRSVAHTAMDGNCIACHGTMSEVASSIDGGRIPWEDEPLCADCHAGIAEVDTGATLYRDAKGHGGLYCAGCHQSPHAMVPSQQVSDNYQALQHQGRALSMGSCAVCHSGSKGDGTEDFLEEHGGAGNPSACAVCHTVITTTDTNQWPHHFEWQNR